MDFISSPVTCPHCGSHLKGYAGCGERAPGPGSMALCWSCRRISVLVASPAGLLLRPATPQETLAAVRSGLVGDIAVAMRDSEGPVEAGLRYAQLSRRRKGLA